MLDLRYNISKWKDLECCKSNNSSDLYIKVSSVLPLCNQLDKVAGQLITIKHKVYGSLFSYFIHEEPTSIINKDIPSLSIDEILLELSKYGFYITFIKYKHLSGSQLHYIMTLNNLLFDKLRTIVVDKKEIVVCFKVANHSDWINANYQPSSKEYIQGLLDGTVFNLSASDVYNEFDWSWVSGYVLNINDIIENNR